MQDINDNVFVLGHGSKTPKDAVNELIRQAGYAVQMAQGIRDRANLIEMEQLFAAEITAAALIQQAAKINDFYGCGVPIPAELITNTQIYPGLV